MRERPDQEGGGEGLHGITPARAGKTNHHSLPGHQITGSPPLVRERPALIPCRMPSQRITPARAGKTLLDEIIAEISEDHPRSCGKDRLPRRPDTGFSGSPPLVRERRDGQVLAELGHGITPARAGKTSSLASSSSRSQDHPRSCGKDPEPHHIGQCEPGSPPLVRERHS